MCCSIEANKERQRSWQTLTLFVSTVGAGEAPMEMTAHCQERSR
jgi:hypothetical protein